MGADGVVIATPPESHVDLAWSALNAGAHAMIEKPLSPDMTETGLLLSRFRQSEKVCMVAYPWRYDRSMNEKRRQVQEELGAPTSWSCWYAYNTANETAKRMGALLDCSHAIDFLRWILGDPNAKPPLSPDAIHGAITLDQQTACLDMRFGVAQGSAVLSLGHPLRCEWSITGKHGTVDWIRSRDVTYDLNDMYLAEAQHFLACIRGEARPLTDGWDARETLRIALAAKKSAAEERWLAR